jgi:hypothetical protein
MYTLDPEKEAVKRLEEDKKRYQELSQAIHERNLQNLADSGEMEHLLFRIKDTIRDLKLLAIEEENSRLAKFPAPPCKRVIKEGSTCGCGLCD